MWEVANEGRSQDAGTTEFEHAWQVGYRVRAEILKDQRAEYVAQIVSAVRRQLMWREDEEPPIGLILCAGQHRETIELLDLERSGIRVSSYWTEVLSKKELERKLHDAVRLARARLESLSILNGNPESMRRRL